MKEKLIFLLVAAVLLSGCSYGDGIYNNLISQTGKEISETKEVGLPAVNRPNFHPDEVESSEDDVKFSEKVHGVVDPAGEKLNGFLKDHNIQTPGEWTQSIKDLFQKDEKKEENKEYVGGNSADRTKFDVAFEQNAESGGLVRVELLKVVDGDTLIVSLDGCRSYIRLIGINTPESVAPDEYLNATGKENTEEGKDASAFTKTILLDTKYVYLEFDKSEYDPYSRILAYVWLNQDKTNISENMLNAVILKNGQAEVMTIEPNVKYREEFERLEDDGR